MTPQQRLKVGAARPWLPSSAFDQGLIERALAPAVTAWTAAWFNAPTPLAAGPLRPWSGQPGDWKVCGAGVGIGCAREARLVLAGRLLGASDIDAPKLNAADKRLGDEFVWRCLADLGDRLAGAVGLGREQVWQGADEADLAETLCAGVGPAQKAPWLRFAIDRALLVPLIREAAEEGALPALSSLEDSIEAQAIAVSALIGRCQVSLSDLASLEAGDVLCLDGRTDEPVALAIEQAVSTAACRIEQDGGALRLRITE